MKLGLVYQDKALNIVTTLTSPGHQATGAH